GSLMNVRANRSNAPGASLGLKNASRLALSAIEPVVVSGSVETVALTVHLRFVASRGASPQHRGSRAAENSVGAGPESTLVDVFLARLDATSAPIGSTSPNVGSTVDHRSSIDDRGSSIVERAGGAFHRSRESALAGVRTASRSAVPQGC